MKTRQAWIGKEEVVEVWYDPEVVDLKALKEFGKARKFKHLPKADAVERLDAEQKYYLLQTPLRGLPMSEAQACRVNASLEGDWRRWLTPLQLEEAKRLLALRANQSETAARSSE